MLEVFGWLPKRLLTGHFAGSLGKVSGVLQDEDVVSQVLMLQDARSRPRFQAVDNPNNKRPLSFEDRDHGVYVPRMGSQALLDLASWARAQGFSVDLIDFADDSMNRVPEVENERISFEVLSALAEQGVDAALDLLEERYSGHAVIGVHLTGETLDSIMVGRNGVVWADDDVSIPEFFAAAWSATHFS